MSAYHRTWWGREVKTKGSHYYPMTKQNPIDWEVPVYRVAQGVCRSCGLSYTPGEGHEIAIVRRYPDPVVRPIAGQDCQPCKRKRPLGRMIESVVRERRARAADPSARPWLIGATLFIVALVVLTLWLWR